MAGRARFKALQEELERRTRETFLLEKDADSKTHLDYVCDWLENGQTAKELAQELEDTLGFEFSSTRLKAYLTECFGPQVDDRLDEARRKGAPHHAELSLAAVTKDASTNVDVSRNASIARTHQWMAEKYDGQKYGNHKHSVTINVGSLHLDALRSRPAMASSTQVTGAGQQGQRLELAPVASVSLPAPARLIGVNVTQDGDSAGVLVSAGQGSEGSSDSDSRQRVTAS